ncbi:S41 family peptidase [Alicyclobacillus acidocaldarius]|uniref:Peptidase S41 n=1 Tax=Alicyclobacillus acidocaldarius subsp. acidocaldarius (strain ATCC 27009 / DSM 446 / BCRC 14685 / JCM 5260 / KCTC 1825 / NBRC 15652 / NCIMB 11725 / NRRL B-14509 / 104-IA) TaxID=521098 RepID=C8WRM0_ALIAD|nr:S41 family peptidase [Alicyclobacillus acidocaldarius]ACV59281.1 peptidase S41 [Alicyclobacillus acidocaldarius subsp. acidocaldarius DSM 446]
MEYEVSLEDRVWMIGKMFAMVERYFAHWEDSRIRPDAWDDRYTACLAEAVRSSTRREFERMMQRLVADLGNRHTWFRDTSNLRGDLGLRLRRLDGSWYVVRSAHAELRPGATVVTLNGRAPEKWMEEASPYMRSREERLREEEWQRVIPALLDDDLWTLELDDGLRRRTVTIHRTRPDSRKEMPEARWLVPDRVAYLRVPSFANPAYEEAAVAWLTRVSNADALVVDVRGNSGGVTPTKLLRALMERPWPWWTEFAADVGFLWLRSAGEGEFSIRPDGSGAIWRPPYEQPEEPVFRGRLAVLVDRATRSAAEDFVMPLLVTKRAIVLGETTSGSTGQPVICQRAGFSMGVGAIRASLPDGRAFENVGLRPDVFVEMSPDDLSSGRDLALALALELLASTG